MTGLDLAEQVNLMLILGKAAESKPVKQEVSRTVLLPLTATYLPTWCFNIQIKLIFVFFFFKKLGQPRPLFVYFRSFQQQFYRKIVDFSGNRTRIVGVEGEHADH